MEPRQATEDDEDEESDGEEIPQTKIVLVNEKDLEGMLHSLIKARIECECMNRCKCHIRRDPFGPYL